MKINLQVVVAITCLFGSGAMALLIARGVAPPFRKSSDGLSVRPDADASELVTPDSLVLGSKDAEVKLVMFGDYQCPPCRREWTLVEAQFRKHPHRWAVYFHNFPIVRIHPQALDAAVLADESKLVGQFLHTHRLLYAEPLDEKRLASVQAQLGLRFASRSDQRLSCARQVQEDINEAIHLQVSGTPTFFVVDGKNAVYSASDINAVFSTSAL